MNTGICSSVIDAVGHTPVVDLARLTADIDGQILSKLEYLNPSGSTVVLVEQSDPQEGVTGDDMKRVEDIADNLAAEHNAFRVD